MVISLCDCPRSEIPAESVLTMEAKYSLNMFAMPVLASALILSLSLTFAETFLGVIETLDLSLKNDQNTRADNNTRRS